MGEGRVTERAEVMLQQLLTGGPTRVRTRLAVSADAAVNEVRVSHLEILIAVAVSIGCTRSSVLTKHVCGLDHLLQHSNALLCRQV